MKEDFSDLKLVIWDLDETLWHGTLSEGSVELEPERMTLLRDLVDCGVMCSICSKNDHDQVSRKLSELGIGDLFVFPSINWSAKGERVKQIISDMNLRPVNVLFLDDNATNRAEVSWFCEGITVADVDLIPKLQAVFRSAEKKDTAHKRLQQYRVLEKKQEFHAAAGSNEEFLRKSDIRVSIQTDCAAHMDRIADLILRTNQLNFTKIRSSREELAALLQDPTYQCGYVEVTDLFGDYGIVGFYALKEHALKHFVFSCRTLNMGVEQYVYHQLGRPQLEIVGDVSSELTGDAPTWINQQSRQQTTEKASLSQGKVLIKGPCDMSQMFAYLKEGQNILTEFVYVNDKGVSIEQGNHTAHIVQSLTLSPEEKQRIIASVPFGDSGMFETHVYDADVDFVVLSLFTDPNLGVYREKSSGAAVAFMEYTNDLTDSSLWQDYIRQNVFVANCQFTEETLTAFAEQYEYAGRLSPEEILANIRFILEHMNPNAHLILVLGSETPFDGNQQPAYADRHLYNRTLNGLVRALCGENNRVHTLDVNDFLTGQESFTNNINHFARSVYYQMSLALSDIIAQNSGIRIRQKSKPRVFLEYITPILYGYCCEIYHGLRRLLGLRED